MALHTVKIDVKPDDALDIFRGHAKREEKEGWQLVQSTSDRLSSTFEIWIDGSPTSTQVVLHQDGTWSASTHVVLGEKL